MPAKPEPAQSESEVDRMAFAMYAQQRCGGLGSDVDVERARLFWSAEDAEQTAMWRSKARGVLAVLAGA